MSVISSISAFFISIAIAFSGWWDDALTKSSVVVDNAASISSVLSLNTTSQSPESFSSSLFDIINLSLDKIKAEITATTTETTQEDTAEDTVTEGDLAEAIVNINCVEKGENYKKTISGTGFFISDRGVVLTNAHVGQFLLLEKADTEGKTECYIKTGETSAAAYDVDLLYISPSWLIKNANIISANQPRGTGESDFALLYVTDAINGAKLPSRFPYLPPTTTALNSKYKNATVILVGYPFTDTIRDQRITATTTITDIYTFKTGYADIMALAPSVLGHEGSSGGPVIDHLGRAIGVITTKDIGTTVLNAITIPHIDRVIKSETGFDLNTTIQGDLVRKAQLFNETVSPILQELLERNIN